MKRFSSFSSYRIFFVLAAMCLGVAVGAYQPLTALMSLHMLVQIPLLILAGVLAERGAWLRRTARLQGIARLQGMDRRTHDTPPRTEAPTPVPRRWSGNEYGVPGLLLASLVGAAWMIPKALDDALTDWRVAVFKYAGLPLCGWILSASARRAPTVIKLFFLGNFCWMSAIVGMVYLDQPVRLCNAYLLSDQDWAGRGLITLAVILPLGWLLIEARPVWRLVNR